MITVKNRRAMPNAPLFEEDDSAKPQQIYIGRGSPLGNPFIIGPHGNRAQVIERYGYWLTGELRPDGNAAIRAEISRIIDLAVQYQEVELICFCKPLSCHGDVIKQVVEASLP